MRALVLFFLILLPLLGSSQARRAISLIEKDKKAEAYELLIRSINKDSVSSAQHFVLASLFIDPLYEFYDIDSAYHQIIAAKIDFSKLDEKSRSRLEGNGFDLASYDTLQKHIEGLGFARAKSLGREEDYINFMELFPESIKLDSAIILRDQQAFLKASAEHSYRSYELFFTTYPEAIDAPEAITRYHLLLYEDKTSSGKLADYKAFLRTYPDTRHRKEAELEIFRIMTGRNTIDAYSEFLKEYPKSYLSKQAKRFSYSRAFRNKKEQLLNDLFNEGTIIDSLNTLNALGDKMVLLGHSGNGYQLMDENGSILLDSINLVAEQNKCNEIEGLILVLEPGANRLVNLLGNEVTRGDFIGYEMVSEGFVKLLFDEGKKIIHLDGSPTTDRLYFELVMPGGYIFFQDQGKWGIESITGISMVAPRFDSVFQFQEHIMIGESGKWGIYEKDDFYPLLDQEAIEYSFPYDSIAIVRNDVLFIQQGLQTGLLDKQLNAIIPLGDPEIELLDNGYFLQTNDSILDSRLANVWYSDIKSNTDWTIGIRSTGTDLYYKGEKEIEVDEAELLGNSAIKVVIRDKSYCYFKPGSRIEMNKGDAIKPIRKMGENSVVRHYLYTDQKNKQSVIDENGKRIKIPRFDRLIDLGEDYMIFSVKGFVYNILDNKGNVILENVDAATSLQGGYISYLSKGKFGLLNTRNATLIKPKYDKPFKMYNDELFVINEGGFVGLVDRKDSLYLSPKFEEIRMLNDSIAVLKANFRWSFWNISSGRVILDNVSDYWEYNTPSGIYYKIFKGIGYGVWNPDSGIILNPTFGELELKWQGEQLIFLTEKWVEEADLVILLYYNHEGELLRKSVLTTRQYEELQCQSEF